VHFREPGLTHKGDIASESRAAVAGGITSYIEQPNTVPNAVTQEILEEKYQIAAKTSYANFSFMMGGTNDNLEEILKTNPRNVAGLKLFLGSSTGDMLVDSSAALESIFSSTKLLIAVHSEDENTVKSNLEHYKAIYGDDIPVALHPEIRSVEACYKSTEKIIKLAKKTGARLHVFHISTAKELDLFTSVNGMEPEDKSTSTIQLNCYMLDQTEIENNPDMRGDYNVARAIATFNKRIGPLLVVFKEEVREQLIVANPEDRGFFTKEQSELINGVPFKESDQDRLKEDVLDISEGEVRYWEKRNMSPDYIYDLASEGWEEFIN
jgi:hypothetical protein